MILNSKNWEPSSYGIPRTIFIKGNKKWATALANRIHNKYKCNIFISTIKTVDIKEVDIVQNVDIVIINFDKIGKEATYLFSYFNVFSGQAFIRNAPDFTLEGFASVSDKTILDEMKSILVPRGKYET